MSEAEAMGEMEARFLKTVKHPYIIDVHQILYDEKRLFIIMEMGMEDLNQRILRLKKQGEMLGELTVKRLMKNILEAVQHMHKSGYIHRDLKPENMIFVGEDLKLVDFGTVRDIGVERERKDRGEIHKVTLTDYVST